MGDIKNILFNEEKDFSDWLSKNLNKLEPFINSTLKLGGTEELIDGKIVDILAEDQEGKIVAIENQFGVSDHKHLGQLLSYCIGLKKEEKEVGNGIWIAEKFHPIHIAVINWLNDTGSGIKFILISIMNPETNQMKEKDKLEFKNPIIKNDVQVGDKIQTHHKDYIKIDDTLKRLIEDYDEEKSKKKPISKAILNGHITGSFIFWVYEKHIKHYKTYFDLDKKSPE